MTREESYRLLGLKPGATEADVRRQFKRMALKVHPDINPDPQANEQFIQLTIAMEILLRPDTSYPFDQYTRTTRKADPSETPEEREKRMQHAKMRFEQQRVRKMQEDVNYFEQLTTGRRWFIFRWIVRAGSILAAILLLDAVLPYHYERDELKAYSKMDHNGILFDRITSVDLSKNGHYFVEIQRGSWLNSYPEVAVEKSWILHTPVAFYSSDDFESVRTGVDFHIGSIRWLLVFLLLVPLITYFRRRKDLTFVFLYQFSFWGVGCVILYMLLSHNRLGHLLSAGFL